MSDMAAFPWTVAPAPAAGTLQRGYLNWSDAPFSAYQWPYIAVRGTRPGRALAITATVHGGEYVGYAGALQFIDALDPEQLSGSILLLPLVNPPAFWARTCFITPLDGKNLNRMFPGSATGTFAEQLAYRIAQQVIAPADALADLHGGDVFESLASFVAGYAFGDERDELVLHAARATGAKYLRFDPIGNVPGVTCTACSASMGKLTYLLEVGCNGLLRPHEADTVARALRNTLIVYGMLDAELEDVSDPVQVERTASLAAPAQGLWLPNVGVEDTVAAGDRLGRILDLLGNELVTVEAPAGGTVLYHLSSMAVHQGDPLMTLVRPVD